MGGGRSSNFGSLGFWYRFGGFWVSGIDLGVSKGHVRIKGWET